MFLSRSTAAFLVVLATLASRVPATPASDATLDSLAFAAVNHDLSGRSGERDRAEAILSRTLAERLASDSGDAGARKRVVELRRLQDARAGARETAWNEIRRLPPEEKALPRLEGFLQRFPDHAEARAMRARISKHAAAAPSPTIAIASAESSLQASPAPEVDSAAQSAGSPSAAQATYPEFSEIDTARCADLSRIEWTQPKSPQHQTSSSELHIAANIWAPCGIAHISLIRGIGDVQALPIPEASGVYSIEANVSIQRGAQTLLIQFCDSLGHCRHSEPLEVRRVVLMPLAVLTTAVGLFLCCLILAITILARRRHAPPPAPRSGLILGPTGDASQAPTALGASNRAPDLAAEIRDALERTTRALGPKFARQTVRIPANLPAISATPEELRNVLDAVFAFSYRRAGADGHVMVATGRGPRNLEMVVEDDCESGDEQALRSIFDPSASVVKERLGMDRELIAATEFFRAIGGELNAEIRIEGGWRLRARMPIAAKPALAPAAN